jgi:hypothetical protein
MFFFYLYKYQFYGSVTCATQKVLVYTNSPSYLVLVLVPVPCTSTGTIVLRKVQAMPVQFPLGQNWQIILEVKKRDSTRFALFFFNKNGSESLHDSHFIK